MKPPPLAPTAPQHKCGVESIVWTDDQTCCARLVRGESETTKWHSLGSMQAVRNYNRAGAADGATKGPACDDDLLRQRTAARGRHVDW